MPVAIFAFELVQQSHNTACACPAARSKQNVGTEIISSALAAFEEL